MMFFIGTWVIFRFHVELRFLEATRKHGEEFTWRPIGMKHFPPQACFECYPIGRSKLQKVSVFRNSIVADV